MNTTYIDNGDGTYSANTTFDPVALQTQIDSLQNLMDTKIAAITNEIQPQIDILNTELNSFVRQVPSAQAILSAATLTANAKLLG